MKNVRKWIVVGVAVLAVATAGFMYWQDGLNSRVPEGIASGNGRIEAVQVDISTKIAGRVSEVLVKEGDLIQSGQTLARIDTVELQAKLLKAKADIASAQSGVASAQAAIAQAKAQLVLAEKNIERASRLVEQGHASKETYDTRVSEHGVAKANLAAADANLISRQRAVDAARATAQEIQSQIDDCSLTSPTIGRVLYRLAEPGEVLSSGGKVLTLVNLADIYMEVFLPAAEAHRASIGNEARIKLDILDFAIPAKVSFVAPESQFTPKQVETASEREKLMFRVKVRVPPELVREHIEKVKTGVRGVAYIKLDGKTKAEWPAFLDKLPPSAEKSASTN